MGVYQLPYDDVYKFFLIFCRLSAAFIFMPGFGDMRVSVRIRILFGLSMSLLLLPVVSSTLPSFPKSPFSLEISVFQELMVGTLIGLVAKILISMAEISGSLVSYTMGLSNAEIFDPEHGGHASITSTLLTTGGMVLIFMLDLHHLLLKALVESFGALSLSEMIFWQDAAKSLLNMVSFVFRIGIQLATPFLIVGLITQIALGLVNRLMPQMQVFFVAMPLQLLGGLLVLMLTTGLMLYAFAENYSLSLQGFMRLLQHG